MPEALAFLPVLLGGSVPFDLAAGTGVIAGTAYIGGVAIGSTALLSTVSTIALSVGLSYAATLFTPKPSAPSQSSQTTVNESTAPRTRVYGRCLVGGGRLIWENVGGARITVIAHCQGPVSAIAQYWLADEIATFVGGLPAFGVTGTVDQPCGGHVALQSFKGTGAQAASPLALANDSLLTADDRARGLCYTVARFGAVSAQDFMSTYKSGEPALRVVIEGSPVYDPRDPAQAAVEPWDAPATWLWSDNPALIILDYMRHPDGRNIALSRFDLDSFAAFADLCDEPVALKHGGTETRYRCSAAYQLTDEPTAVMQRLLATCDGEIYRTAAGLLAIRGGQWVEPALTFEGDAILAFSLAQGSGKLVTFNRAAITYTSPDHNYQSVEADPWVDAASEALIGSLPTSLALDAVPSASQARRLAKINAAKANPAWKGSVTLDITGLNALDERVIRLVLPEDDLGLNQAFLVTKAQVSGDLAKVELTIVSLDASAYAWTPASEEGEAPPIVPTLDSSAAVPTPAGLTAVVTTGTYGGVTASSIQVTVTTPADPTLLLLVRYAVAGSGNWTQGTALAGVYTWNTGVLADGLSYDVQAKFVASSTVQGGWTSTTTVAVAAGGAAPATPSGLSASAAAGTVTLGATAPNSSSVNRIVFWRSAGTVFGSAVRLPNIYCSPNQTVAASDTPGVGTWHYWATAENSGGAASSPAGYMTVTV